MNAVSLALLEAPAAGSPFKIRVARPVEDYGFVRNQWLASDRRSAAARDEGRGYFANQKARIADILARPSTVVEVACDVADDDALAGFAVTGARRIYYVFVRHEARRLGLARALLTPFARDVHIEFTHRPIVPYLPIPAAWRYHRDANACGFETS